MHVDGSSSVYVWTLPFDDGKYQEVFLHLELNETRTQIQQLGEVT
jgi:hypothetical protein